MAADGLYKGNSDEVVLILGGIHESEQSGVEIVCWVRALLDGLEKQGKKPVKTVKVIPDIDENARGQLARSLYRKLAKGGPPKQQNVIKSKFREVMDAEIVVDPKPPSVDSKEGKSHIILKPNRMFPAPGFPRQWLGVEPGKMLDDYIKLLESNKAALNILYPGAVLVDWIFTRLPLASYVYSPSGPISQIANVVPENTPRNPSANLISRKDKIRSFKPTTDLMDVIEALRPIRIVSCHGMVLKDDGYVRTTDDSFPGIFVDPRYAVSGVQVREFIEDRLKVVNPKKPGTKIVAKSLDYLKFTADTPGSAISREGKDDDQLALRAAQHVFNNKENASKRTRGRENPVAGNWLDPSLKVDPVVHYHFDSGTSNPADEKNNLKDGSFRATGFSLGDWGPVDVTQSGTLSDASEARGRRKGAPVFTVEPANYYPSGAFDIDLKQLVDKDGKLTAEGTARKWDVKGTDLARATELRTFAEAIIEVICETKL